jgi:FKBP-type peptidyl-prolyl cis-trans isomerase
VDKGKSAAGSNLLVPFPQTSNRSRKLPTKRRCAQTVLREGNGVDQLGSVHGPPGEGDWVKIHYEGKVASSGKEFEDTYHRELPAHFQIKKGETGITDKVTWTTGLAEAVQTMTFGEKCVVTIEADSAYGSAGHGSNYGKVPPNEDVVLTCELMQINTFRREQPKDDSCCIWKILYCFCRAY